MEQYNCIVSWKQMENAEWIFQHPPPPPPPPNCCAFIISGGRCYDISEQRSCGPWQKSDGQWRRRPFKIPTYQHLGTVLGELFGTWKHRKLPCRSRDFPWQSKDLSSSYFDSTEKRQLQTRLAFHFMRVFFSKYGSYFVRMFLKTFIWDFL